MLSVTLEAIGVLLPVLVFLDKFLHWFLRLVTLVLAFGVVFSIAAIVHFARAKGEGKLRLVGPVLGILWLLLALIVSLMIFAMQGYVYYDG